MFFSQIRNTQKYRLFRILNSVMGPSIAIIYMHSVETRILQELPATVLWKRYIDDVFIVWPTEVSADHILRLANSCNEKIQFSMEFPMNDVLPFLDCEVYRDGLNFQTRLYFKSIHSGAICHWKSYGPQSEKRSIALGELHRAVSRSTNDVNENDSIRKVLDRFRSNGYPDNFLKRVLASFNNRDTHDRIQNTEKPVFLRVPYLGEKHKRQSLSLLKRTGLSHKVRIQFDCGPPMKRFLKSPKESNLCDTSCDTCAISKKPNRCLNKFVVYKIICNICNHVYIGETSRTIQSRIREHIRVGSPSAVRIHYEEEHPDSSACNVTWEILYHNIRNWNKRLSLEAICISECMEPLMNGCIGRRIVHV